MTLSGKGGRSDILETLEGEGGWAGTAIRKQDRQLGEKKEPPGGSKRIAPEKFGVAPQAILSVTNHVDEYMNCYRRAQIGDYKPARIVFYIALVREPIQVIFW